MGAGGVLAQPDNAHKMAESSGVPAAPPAGRSEVLRTSLCAVLILLGLAVIIGWKLDIDRLKSLAPGFSTMKFNTAIELVLTGVGVWLAGYDRRVIRYASAAIGIIIVAFALMTAAEYVLHADWGIDQLFVTDAGTLRGSGYPGRMSILTATAMTLLGTAIILLALATRRAEVIAAHCLAMLAGALSVLAVGGYAFGAEAFWGIGPYTFIALHTAFGIVAAAAATLMTRAREGWLQPYVDSPAALALLMRVLPLFLVVPLALGLLIMLGAGIGAYNAPFGFALFIPLTSAAMILSALWVAGRQRDAEQVRLQYERHLQLVVAELNHRVKNTLSIVQSFAHQSLTASASPEDAAVAFEGRLKALATAHNMLTRENWDSISLTELIANSLDAHNDTGTRFAVEGPELPVSPKTAITFAMTLHELATNSTKYGALSAPEGYVRIAWSVQDGVFYFTWKDCEGPATKVPTRRGFGTRMLQRALASELGGKASLNYEPDGLRFEISAPEHDEL
jgi:two-component sensor histidine kinase